MLRKGPPAPIPALATAMSNTPSEFAAALTASFTAPELVTSQLLLRCYLERQRRRAIEVLLLSGLLFRRPAIALLLH